LRKFLRFAGLAGCGWLLDFGILLVLVRGGGVGAGRANVVSSLIAAGSVFLASRVLVFDGRPGAVPARLGLYLLYVLGVIVAASAAVAVLTARLTGPAGLLGVRLAGATAAAAAAKVLVTPPQLVLNFFVSRFLSERPAPRAGSVAGA
jgi:putative flippase GtrA